MENEEWESEIEREREREIRKQNNLKHFLYITSPKLKLKTKKLKLKISLTSNSVTKNHSNYKQEEVAIKVSFVVEYHRLIVGNFWNWSSAENFITVTLINANYTSTTSTTPNYLYVKLILCNLIPIAILHPQQQL